MPAFVHAMMFGFSSNDSVNGITLADPGAIVASTLLA